MPWLSLTRLALHLVVGLWKVAVLFPFLDATGRESRVQRWSRQLVALCGVPGSGKSTLCEALAAAAAPSVAVRWVSFDSHERAHCPVDRPFDPAAWKAREAERGRTAAAA